MNTATFRHKHELPVVFVHSVLDELGLSAAEFRLYCHLARRADNSTRVAYAAHDSMASVCRLDIKTVRRALQALVERGMITVERRPGYPNCYRLAPRSYWQSGVDAEDDFVRPGFPTMPPWCGTGKEVGCQTGKEATPSAPHEGNPQVLLQEGNPQKHTEGEPQSEQEASRVRTPAASFRVPVVRLEVARNSEPAEHPAPASSSSHRAPRRHYTAPKSNSQERKITARVHERFAKLWSCVRPEYRGDAQPALMAFAALNPDEAEIERIATHREAWDTRAADSENGVTGWVPKPKHLANYLRVRQFDTPLPEPRPLRPVRISGVPAAYTPPPPTPEAKRIAELKCLGIVALDLLNGRAELEDHYAFATDVVGPVRYQQILAIEDQLRQMHADSKCR